MNPEVVFMLWLLIIAAVMLPLGLAGWVWDLYKKLRQQAKHIDSLKRENFLEARAKTYYREYALELHGHITKVIGALSPFVEVKGTCVTEEFKHFDPERRHTYRMKGLMDLLGPSIELRKNDFKNDIHSALLGGGLGCALGGPR